MTPNDRKYLTWLGGLTKPPTTPEAVLAYAAEQLRIGRVDDITNGLRLWAETHGQDDEPQSEGGFV